MPLAGRAALTLASLGGVLLGVFALSPSVATRSACLGVAALCSMAALIAGPLINQPASPRPWRMIAAAAFVFLVGVLARPWAAGQPGLTVGTADLFTLSGYALLIGALGLMLRRRGKLEAHAITDGVIVCLGSAAVSIVLFSLPAAAVLDRPVVISVIAGLYPLLDVVLLLLVLNLGFTVPAGLPSFRAISIAMVSLFAGDIGYAWIGASGQLSGSHLLDLPFIITYLGFGYAALHPSMVQMAEAVPRSIQPWSARRLALIIPALAAPVVLLAFSDRDLTDRLVISIATAAVVAAMVVRSVRAVHDYALAQEVLRRRATHDALTEMPNRLLLVERLQAMLAHSSRQGREVWLLYLDLDGFKYVNDTWGHETGDQLLVEVGHRLSGAAGRGVTVARTGGDEFAIALRLPAPEVKALAENVLAELREPLSVDGLELVVTASIGLAQSSYRGAAEGLLRDADTAMYQAKADGRNRIVAFDASMRQTVRDRVEIELALRQAIARDQLWIAYQPIVDLVSERVIGAEALLRWSHPVRGQISPVEFIPVAEETGLISEIGAWVLRQSLRQVAAWRDAGVAGDDFVISVNVSTRQLRDGGLRDAIEEVLSETGLSPRNLIVEMTESVMLEQCPAVGDLLAELRFLGVGLSVDDFGTGYSSLSYLSRYPVSGVKIDRGFIAGLGGAAGDEVIVRAVAAMAGAFELSVVAEGVETAAQRDVLRDIGIPHGQGWLWGRAVDATEFAATFGLAGHAQVGMGNS